MKLKTPITYYGGKQSMLKHIRPLIPKHTLYTEAFAGGCAVLFDKEPAEVEVINDLNIELINFYVTCVIESDDALRVIARYDTPEAFHFVDPPYVGSNMGHYSNMFNDDNLRDLLELLSTLKGKFMLTMYPNDVILAYVERFGWHIVKVDRQISACKAESRRMQEEWMVMNYSIEANQELTRAA